MTKGLLILLAVVLVLGSCQFARPTGTPVWTPQGQDATPEFSEIIVGFVEGFEPSWLWLPKPLGPISPVDLAFESLLSLSPTGNLRPNLANFEISPEGTAITFTLKSGIFWHSGKQLTAFDAATFLEAAFSPEHRGPLSSKSTLLESIKVLSEQSFLVTLKEPDCSLISDLGLLRLTRPPSFPSLPPLDRLEGTGPFRIIKWSESEITLEKFQAYPGEKRSFQRVHFRRYGSGEEILKAFREREIGAFILKPGEEIPPKEAARLLSPELYFLAFNLKDHFLKEADVRRALVMAVNREELLREVLNGEGILAKGPFLPGHLEEEPDLPPFNPAEAKKILEERGWFKGGMAPKVGIMVNGENKVREAIALRVARYYRAIGIDAEVWVMEWGNFLEALFGGYFQVAVFSIPLGPDLDLSPFFSSAGDFNFSSLQEPEVDKLLKNGLKVAGCNPQARKKLYSSLAFTLTELRPWDFLFFPYYFLWPEELSFLKQS